MEAFEIMEMDMEFLRKLPTPKELKEQFPVSEKIAAIKADRDRQIREIFEGKDVISFSSFWQSIFNLQKSNFL